MNLRGSVPCHRRIGVAAASALLAVGCATSAPSHNIEFASLSSRLYVQGDDGRIVSPFGGKVIGVADMDFVLAADAIGIPPGHHWIRGNCPPPAVIATNGSGELPYIESTHGFNLGHEFEIGRSYLLRCVDGHPEIIPYEPAP